MMDNIIENIKEIFNDDILKAVISNPVSKNEKYRKIDIRKKDTKDKLFYQFESYTKTQVFHSNADKDSLIPKICGLIKNYRQLDAWSEKYVYSLKISKKGKAALIRRINKENGDRLSKEVSSHNKEKNYIIKSGEVIPPLVDLGIFTKEGKVVNSMYDKFKQINRFIEMIDDVVSQFKRETLRVIDFGCGKSYLTFILYHYLVNIKGIRAKITGLDLKEKVIENCNALAKKYGYDGLEFRCGDIADFECDEKIDMVITLHACDIATDLALFHAIRWNTEAIFSVPCCQHEVNSQIKSEKFSALTKYGLIKERFSALVPDSIRGCLLENQGYSVNLMEFVDMAHSPKNILIRAVKQNVSEKKKKESRLEAERLIKEFDFNQTLYRLLDENEMLIF